jgi:membrane-associated protein
MIPGVDLITFIKTVSIIGVAIVVFAESGLLIGFFLPGDSLLFTVGFLINIGTLSVNLHVAAFVFFIAAVLGDSVGYAFGERIGRKVLFKQTSKFLKKEYLERAEAFYKKHGGVTILVARFIPIIRTFVPVVAGVSDMTYKSFIVYNLIGGFLWATGITYAGYYLGAWFKYMGLNIDQIILPAALIIILISVVPIFVRILKEKSNRTYVSNFFKRLLNRKK